jgi:hypothetical protein
MFAIFELRSEVRSKGSILDRDKRVVGGKKTRETRRSQVQDDLRWGDVVFCRCVPGTTLSSRALGEFSMLLLWRAGGVINAPALGSRKPP